MINNSYLKLGLVAFTTILTFTGVCSSVYADSYKGKGKYKKVWAPAVKALRVDGQQVPGGCPIESPEGRFLFTARNPGSGLDIFANQISTEIEGFELGAPLPAPVNDENLANDFCPTPLPDNGLFFVSTRSGGCGGTDLLSAVQHPATGWSEPLNLGCYPDGPNTPGTELSPALIKTKWGTYLFYSSDYPTGNQDIYRSKQRKDGSFTPGERLEYPINTEYDDRQPNLSQDGRKLVFASNRPSSEGDETGFDIFYAKRHFLFGPWKKLINLSEKVPFETVGTDETRPTLSWDEKRIYYGSGGVWVSERE